MSEQLQQLRLLLQRSRFPKKQLSFVLFLSLLETFTGLAVPILTMNLINEFSASGLNWLTVAIVASVLILQAILGGFSYYFLRKLGERVVANLRGELWHKVLYLQVPYYDAHESGETMSRITQDTSVVKELVTDQLISFVSGILTITGAVIVLLWIDWRMTILMLIAVPITILITVPLAQKIHKISKANQDELATLTSQLGRVLMNIRLVKAMQTEVREKKHGHTKIENLYQFGLKEAKILAFLSPIMTLMMMLVLIVIFGYGGARVASGAISSGELVAIIIYLVQIIIPFTQMATFFTALQKALGATERMHTMFNEVEEQQIGQTITSTLQPIHFKDVHFRYNEQPILKGITFTIEPNQTTALVSSSGGGKTTIFSLIERFYDVTTGSIQFGQQPISTFNLSQWRQLFSYVSQEAPIMNGSIRDNLLYGKPDATTQEIERALITAYADEFIQQLPEGLDTQVGEAGVKLSGGQKQRLAIARAILRNAPILLLDEATSNLDNESEREVQLALQQLKKDRTTIIIAHRLSTITHADQILILEEGKLSGSGTHDELLHSHAYYKQLWTNAI